MKGKVYFVATPIGNLKDITLRALETLREADIIACEDTRHSLKLLNHYEIKKPLIALHKFNERNAVQEVFRILDGGKNLAVISDAGMPCISDPGALLVNALRENGYEYTVIGGNSALASAVVLSGIDGPFTFIGFLPEKKKDRIELLKSFENTPSHLIFYCAPHDLEEYIQLFYSVYGSRKVSLVKEISKIHESVTEFALGGSTPDLIRGEYVIILHKEIKGKKEISDEDIITALKEKISNGIDKKTAVMEVTKELNQSKNKVYRISLEID